MRFLATLLSLLVNIILDQELEAVFVFLADYRAWSFNWRKWISLLIFQYATTTLWQHFWTSLLIFRCFYSCCWCHCDIRSCARVKIAEIMQRLFISILKAMCVQQIFISCMSTNACSMDALRVASVWVLWRVTRIIWWRRGRISGVVWHIFILTAVVFRNTEQVWL